MNKVDKKEALSVILNTRRYYTKDYYLVEEKQRVEELFPSEEEIEHILNVCLNKGIDVYYIHEVLKSYMSEYKDMLYFEFRQKQIDDWRQNREFMERNYKINKSKEYICKNNILPMIEFMAEKNITHLNISYYPRGYYYLFSNENRLEKTEDFLRVLTVINESDSKGWNTDKVSDFIKMSKYYKGFRESKIKGW